MTAPIGNRFASKRGRRVHQYRHPLCILKLVANALRVRSLNYRKRKIYRAMVNLSIFMWKAGSNG